MHIFKSAQFLKVKNRVEEALALVWLCSTVLSEKAGEETIEYT